METCGKELHALSNNAERKLGFTGSNNLVPMRADPYAPAPMVFTLPSPMEDPSSESNQSKVVTTLPAEEDAPRPKPSFVITADQLDIGQDPSSHRGRATCVFLVLGTDFYQ